MEGGWPVAFDRMSWWNGVTWVPGRPPGAANANQATTPGAPGFPSPTAPLALFLVAPGYGATQASLPKSILFVGNSFTYGELSPVRHFQPDSVTDLNREGTGGVPALLKAFRRCTR